MKTKFTANPCSSTVKSGPWAVPQLRSKCPLGSAPAPVPPRQCPSSAPVPPQGAPGGSGRFGTPRARGRPSGRPATASGARASRLQSRPFPPPLTM
eukprot:scaffold123835_cov57-Phaeocystis_antarctica.AAC.5